MRTNNQAYRQYRRTVKLRANLYVITLYVIVLALVPYVKSVIN